MLAAIGAAVGMAGAVLFGAAILYGLRTWWVDAVGTTRLTLAVSPGPLLLGALGGLVAAGITLLLDAEAVGHLGTEGPAVGPRADGVASAEDRRRAALAPIRAIGFVFALGLVGASATGAMPQTAAFFAAGGALLVAAAL